MHADGMTWAAATGSELTRAREVGEIEQAQPHQHHRDLFLSLPIEVALASIQKYHNDVMRTSIAAT